MTKTEAKPVSIAQNHRPQLPENWQLMNATERTRSIIAREDLSSFIGNLPSDKLYLLIHDLGVDSSLELFDYVKREQWQGIVDLSCWQEDAVTPELFASWYQVAATAGPKCALDLLMGVDEELLVSVLKSIATIEENDLDKDFVSDELEILTSPDGQFYILIERNHPLIPYVHQSLLVLFEESILKGRRILRSSRFELGTQLTETAFQFRSARLEDLGFLSFETAVEIFEPLALDDLRARIEEETSPQDLPHYSPLHKSVSGIDLYGKHQQLFLHQVMATLPRGPAKTALEEHFTYLINRHCIASRVEMSDALGIQVAAMQTYAMVNLGLESLAGENVPLGAKVLEKIWISELYRAGYTKLLRPQKASRALLGISAEFALFGHPLEPLLKSLSTLVPSSVQGFTEEGEVVLRPIATQEELENVRASVHYATSIAQTFKERLGVKVRSLETDPLPGIPEEARSGLTYATLLLTGLANHSLGRGFSLELLSEVQVEGFANRVFEGIGGDRKIRKETRESLEQGILQAIGDDSSIGRCFGLFLGQSLDQLEVSLKDIPPGQAIDSRFLDGLLLTQQKETA